MCGVSMSGRRGARRCARFMAALIALPCAVGGAWAQPAPAIRVTPAGMPSGGGAIVVKVADFGIARESVMYAARQQGAQLLDARTEVNGKGKKHGWMRFQLAAERWPALVPAVHAVGKLYSERMSTTDHQSEYEELERRVTRLREHEKRLDSLLSNPKRLRGSDILYIQERILRAAIDEELMLQRRSDFERAARVDTLVVTLFEPESLPALDVAKSDVGGWWQRATRQAKLDFGHLLGKMAAAGAYALVFAPAWVPALIVAFFLGRLLWRRARILIAYARAQAQHLVERLRASRPPAAPPPGAAEA